MNSQNGSKREKDCKKKIPYDLKSHASSVAKDSRNKRNGKLIPYKCDICGFWHLTSVSKSKKRRHKKYNRKLKAFQETLSYGNLSIRDLK
jgi:hypothetical protein